MKFRLQWSHSCLTRPLIHITPPPPWEFKASYGKCPCHHIQVCMKSLLQIFCLNEENEKIGHNLELFSSPQERGEQQRPSYIFIRSGDGYGPFPESVTARRARRFIHQSSQLHRLFILPWRPTSEARPIKFSHFCPNACHSIRIGRRRSSRLALRPASHLS